MDKLSTRPQGTPDRRKAIRLNKQQTEQVVALLRRMQYVVSNDDNKYLLFWGDEDWYVVFDCMIAAGALVVPGVRPPYKAFVSFLADNAVNFRDPLTSLDMTRQAEYMKGGFPWKEAEKTPHGICRNRWIKLYNWLLPQLRGIMLGMVE